MNFELMFTVQADNDLTDLESNANLKKRLKAVRKALGYLQINPRHPSLNTHKFSSLQGKNGEDIFEAYAENDTPENRMILGLAFTGILILSFAALNASHHLMVETQERIATFAGSFLIICAHYRNWKFIRKINCNSCQCAKSGDFLS